MGRRDRGGLSARRREDTRKRTTQARLRLVAFPWAFLVDVCRLTEGRTALVLAEYIYRRTHVCDSQTVTLPGAELAELGIDRPQKHKALAQLARAGFIRIEQTGTGRAVRVTLQWQSGGTVAWGNGNRCLGETVPLPAGNPGPSISLLSSLFSSQ